MSISKDSYKIKIIDIINKIAKGEEPPGVIWYGNNPYRYNGTDYIYDSGDYFNKSLTYHEPFLTAKMLNEEVEVEDED